MKYCTGCGKENLEIANFCKGCGKTFDRIEIKQEGTENNNESGGVKNLKDKVQYGDIEAMCILGDIYSKGKYAKKDDALAHKYYLMAAEQGNVKAQIEAGNAYITGSGVNQDIEKGVFWLSCAYLQGEKFPKEGNDAKELLNYLIDSGYLVVWSGYVRLWIILRAAIHSI